jgi:branched-chain amino acid aminotransferase
VPSVILIDGVATAEADARVSVRDRGFLYGDTVFETIRVDVGVPFLLERHVARLRRSAEIVGIELSTGDGALADEVRAAVRASAMDEAVVRVTVSRGEGPRGLDPRRARAPRRVVVVDPLPLSLRGGAAAPPVAVRVVPGVPRGIAASAKTGSYVEAIAALRVAQDAGDDDAVMVDERELLLEATAANVFVVGANGGLVTPEERGIFAGITRAEVMRIARERGLGVEARPVSASELRSASEAFLTSSVKELVGVSRVDGVPLGTATEGEVTRRLRMAYRESVRRERGSST